MFSKHAKYCWVVTCENDLLIALLVRPTSCQPTYLMHSDCLGLHFLKEISSSVADWHSKNAEFLTRDKFQTALFLFFRGKSWIKFDPFSLHWSCSPSTCHKDKSREATLKQAKWIKLDLGKSYTMYIPYWPTSLYKTDVKLATFKIS